MTSQPLRILHVTVQRALSAGQRKQLRYETKASQSLDGALWHTLAVHKGEQIDGFDCPIPFLLSGLLLRWLYGWIVVWRLSKRYDYVLLRHMTFDPFAPLFAPFIRNRIGVHHSKEIEEMPLIRPGVGGKLAAIAEKIFGKVAVHTSAGILGVTKELAYYERNLRAPSKPCFHYPNGIDPEAVSAAGDTRVADEINAVFICGTFNAWHGLDRLVAAVREADAMPTGLAIHLIGRLSNAQLEAIEALGERSRAFEIHGFLTTENYAGLLALADVGIGSLAMDRQNLSEGATLKVREMLAAGIPVFSNHRDTSVPADFAFYRVEGRIEIPSLAAFASTMKAVSRNEIRYRSLPLIAKQSAMQNVVEWLRDLDEVGRRKCAQIRENLTGSSTGTNVQ